MVLSIDRKQIVYNGYIEIKRYFFHIIYYRLLWLFQLCEYCKRLGATIRCHVDGCSRFYHFPCAAASGSFQSMKQLILLCPEHIEKAEELGKWTRHSYQNVDVIIIWYMLTVKACIYRYITKMFKMCLLAINVLSFLQCYFVYSW